MSSYAWIVGVLAFVVHGAALHVYDKILKLQHERVPNAWERSRGDIGNFWAPPMATFAQRFFLVKGIQSGEWLFRTPAWAKPHEDVRRLLVGYRTLEAIALAALVVCGCFAATAA